MEAGLLSAECDSLLVGRRSGDCPRSPSSALTRAPARLCWDDFDTDTKRYPRFATFTHRCAPYPSAENSRVRAAGSHDYAHQPLSAAVRGCRFVPPVTGNAGQTPGTPKGLNLFATPTSEDPLGWCGYASPQVGHLTDLKTPHNQNFFAPLAAALGLSGRPAFVRQFRRRSDARQSHSFQPMARRNGRRLSGRKSISLSDLRTRTSERIRINRLT